MYYILDEEHRVVPEPDVKAWGSWIQRPTRVGKWEHESGVWVSTVFLGLDHGFGSGDPLLFETMVFGIEDTDSMAENWTDRCSTWDEAVAMHERGVQWALANMKAPRKRSDRAIELPDEENK